MPHGYNLILTLLLQLALILALSRFVGWVFAYFRQPQVVGEMVAGIMLGPSVLGLLAPDLAKSIFPAESVQYLSVLSQIGVIFFMFLVGLELDPKLLRNRGHTALVVSHVSIVAPFLLGAALTLYLYPRLFNDSPLMNFTSVALFMGAAMSITAFPVLARILTERNIHKTNVGAVAITCAAVDDVTAWCMLAFVVGIARADGIAPGIRTAVLSVVYVALMFVLVRPFLRRIQGLYERRGHLTQTLVAVVFLLALLSAFATEWIGIHALFGAFLMGAIMPKGTKFVRALSEKLEDYTVVFLLPIFFAFTGLRTQIGLLNNADLWFDTALIIAVACLGKFGGSALAGRACGLGWREASTVGILMNTRGLMELVILNIGLQEGVITPAVFAMMVIMALVTTALTTPILFWVFPTRLPTGPAPLPEHKGFRVLIPISLPESGPSLARLAGMLIGANGQPDAGRALALHLRRPAAHEAYRSGLDENSEDQGLASLTPLLAEATKRKLPVEPISFVTQDVAEDIAAVAQARQVDLVLMGFHKPVFTKTILGGIVHQVLTECQSDVAILVDRGMADVRRILVPFMGSTHDRLAMELAARVARSSPDSRITVLHVVDPANGQGKLGAKGIVERAFEDPQKVTLEVVEDGSPIDAVMNKAAQYDLLVVGMDEEWGLESRFIGLRPERIAQEYPGS
ncbi:MAG TPA: cation:proton antiporter, partial [Tepidisphaeraceae bacterium]